MCSVQSTAVFVGYPTSKTPIVDLSQFFADFQDHLAPKLDTYEQAIYLYVFRHSRLIGLDEVVIGFKSARKKIAQGIGAKGTPMSDRVCYEKIDSLVAKGCVERLGTEWAGTRLRLKLPSEIPGIISLLTPTPVDLEQLDFFTDAANRRLIIEREGGKCFYCLRLLTDQSSVIEHVESRPEGNNSYRNVVAACRQCNNRKNASSADDWLRTLYREGLLSAGEFEDRLSHIQQLRTGLLKPRMPA
jgi:hypothetical protein